MQRRNVLGAVAAAMLALTGFSFSSAPAAAQYPDRPVHIVVPFPAGSASDAITRIIGQHLSDLFGKPVVIENKPGADGAIAATEISRQPPDGYNLLMATNSPLVAVPTMKSKPPYDPIKDFTPISFVGKFNYFVLVRSDLPVKTLPEFIDHVRKNPDKLNYGTGNTTGIVATAQIMKIAGIKMTHVPYRGEPAALADLLPGRIDFMVATQTTTLPFVQQGKLRALATTSSERSKGAPEVPTLIEAGLSQFTILPWAALVGPPNMPADVVARINKDLAVVLAKPEVRQLMDAQFFEPNSSTPDELATFLREQLTVWTTVVNELGLKE